MHVFTLEQITPAFQLVSIGRYGHKTVDTADQNGGRRKYRFIHARARQTAMASAPKPRAGHFNVLYFAGASTFTGKDFEELPAPFALGYLFAQLESMYPGIKSRILDSCLVTVNLEYVDLPADAAERDDESGLVVQSGDEVAIIPPVSSG